MINIRSVLLIVLICCAFVFSGRAAQHQVVNLNDSGTGSLRDIVGLASTGDTIYFQVTGTISLTSGYIDIPFDLDIIGPGWGDLSIDGLGTERLFQIVNAGVDLYIHGINFINAGNHAFYLSNNSSLLAIYCHFDNCTDANFGGAIYNSDSQVDISHCSFVNCVAGTWGGALFGTTNAQFDITSTTFVGNSAGSGGGLYLQSGSNVDMLNVTMTANASTSGGGAITNVSSTISGENSIIAANNGPVSSRNISGEFSSIGHNCVDDDLGISGALWPGTGDLVNINPLFIAASADDNGRRLITVDLQPSSPCIDAGNSAANGDPEDQRGILRQLDGDLNGTIDIDIGALEYTPFCVTNTSGLAVPGSLPYVLSQIHTGAPLGAAPFYVCFKIAGSGVQTITPAAALPTFVNGATYIDGFTQIDARPRTGVSLGTIHIEVEGSALSGAAVGFSIPAGGSGSLIQGLNINSFPAQGIVITGASDVLVMGNYIGTDDSGSGAMPNASGGVMLQSNATLCEIGGDDYWKGNVISGNAGYGLTLTTGSFDNIIERNYIGMSADGLNSVPNTGGGVQINNASGNQIGSPGHGNLISGNTGNGVFIHSNANNNNVEDNTIGLNLWRTAIEGNTGYGVSISTDAYNNVIGGPNQWQGNNISGNGIHGVYISNAGTGNQVFHNAIGVNFDASAAFPNGGDGIRVSGGIGGTQIGAAGMGNLISGHSSVGDVGIRLAGDDVAVQGNLIGTNGSGTSALPNHNGIYITSNNNLIGGPNAGEGNLVSGNSAFGINIFSGSANLVQGNNCGLDVNFANNLANNIGIYIAGDNNTIGGIGVNDANICSGNNFEGIRIDGSDANVLHGNIIGLDNTGTNTFGNQGAGILVTNGAANNTIGGDRSLGEGNIISGNGSYGINVTNSITDNTQIYGNIIGLDGTGTLVLPNSTGIYVNVASNTLIGGGTLNLRNIISGNNGDGIEVTSSGPGTTISGNYIGTDIDANNARPNTGIGVEVRSTNTNAVVIDGTSFPNVISGNTMMGIELESDSNVVQGNLIGTNSLGNSLPNSVGVLISGSNNLIGGTLTGQGNTIAYNNTDGIQITVATSNHNSFLQNSIFSNGTTDPDMGIDLSNDGVTGNDISLDGDTGPNGLQNYPVFGDPTLCGTDLYVAFDLNSMANTDYYIEFFITPPALVDGSGYGEALQYIGSTTVTTDSVGSHHSQLILNGSFTVGDFLTATATDLSTGSPRATSEFAQCRQIQPQITSVQFGNINPSCSGGSDGQIFPQVVAGGVAPYYYAWSDGQTTDTAYNLPAGTYNATVTDENGCPFVGTSVSLTPPPPLAASLNISHEVCDGNCDGFVVVSASGGTAPYTYEEVGGTVSPNDSILNLCDGNATIRVTDGAGCILDSTITINPGVVENSTLGYVQNLWCVSDSIFSPSTIGTAGGAFTVLPAAGLDINLSTGVIDPSNSIPGPYTVTYTTPTCGLQSNYLITVNAVDDASFFYASDTFCIASGNAIPTVTGLTGGGFTAQTGIAISAGSGTIDLVNCTPGGPYEVYYTTSGTCPNTDTFEVAIIDMPNAAISNPITQACQGDVPFNLTGANPGGTWSGVGITDALNGTFDPGSASIGLNEIVHEIDAGFGCIDSDTVYIEVFDHPTATISGGGTYCAGDQPPTIDITFGGQTTNSTFDVYIDGNYNQTLNVSGNPTTISPGTGTITIQNIVSVDGCTSLNATNSIDIIEVQPPPAPITNYTDTIFCTGGTIEDITATTASGGSLIWYDDAGLTNQVGTGSPFTPTLNVGTNTFYVVEDASGCVGPARQVNINYVNVLPPTTLANIDYCPGDSILPLNASANGGGTITWFSDAALTTILGTGTSLIIPQGLTGSNMYWVTESVGDCQSSAVQVNVVVYDGTFTGAGDDFTICAGDSVQLGGFGGASYLWIPALNLSDPTAATPFASPDTTTTYTVAVTNPQGCVFRDSVVVTVQSAEECGLHVFNAFTPDGDGVNDAWLIEGLVGYTDNQVIILNRWGDELNYFDGYDNSDVVWDGTNKAGENLPTGTYYYIIKLNDIDETYSGWVYLER